MATEKSHNETRLTLIQRLQLSQSEPNWDEFNRIYGGYIFAVAHALKLPPADCEDIRQTVLLNVWKGIGKFTHDGRPGRFRAWLNTITRNEVFKHLNRKNRKARGLDELQVHEQSVSEPEIEAIEQREWGIHVTNLAWTKISPGLSNVMREIFQLSLDGVSREEIAKRVDCPVNTVSVYKRRVVARMRREIQLLEAEIT